MGSEIELGEVLVSGIHPEVRYATLQLRCTACPETIVEGSRYVRVETRTLKRVERYHVSCFRREFTNA